MNKVEALRLKPGTELRVQYGNGRPLPKEKRIHVAQVKWERSPFYAAVVEGGIHTAEIPMRSGEAKRVASRAAWVSVISTDGEDFGSNEVVHIAEEP